jgi:beta-glucosidase
MEGEASSRATLGFTGAQQQLLEAVVATGKPVILVLLAGRPLELKWAAEHVPAILEAWSPGIEAGPAVADVLFGDVNPSGKLPASLPRSVGQEPLYYAQLPTGRPAFGDQSHFPRNPA